MSTLLAVSDSFEYLCYAHTTINRNTSYFIFFSAWTVFIHVSECDVFRRQIPTYKNDPCAESVQIC